MSTTSLPQIDARLRPIKRKMVQAKQRHPLAELTCESFDSLSDKEVFRRYKVALKTDENRIDFMIKCWGSFSWVAFQGDKAFWVGDGQNVKKVEQVEIKRAYPTQSQIQTAAKKSSKPIFMFWNTKPEMIKKIFQLDQTQLPSIMRTYFGLSLAGPLANMYLSGDEKTALGFAENLNPVGKLEFSKNVFKQLAGKSNRSHKKFARTFAEAKLPVVVEVFKSAVMEFEGRDTAWVSLEKWEGGSTLTEPFNLNTLRRSGVKYEHQLFEYTVYEDVLPVVGTDIDPVVAQEASLPTSAFQ